MIGCGEIHKREYGETAAAIDLRPIGEILAGSSPATRIDCFENLQDPENNIKFDNTSILYMCIGNGLHLQNNKHSYRQMLHR